MSKFQSAVWELFKIDENDDTNAICQVCPDGIAVISRGRKRVNQNQTVTNVSLSTSPLWNHIQYKHPEKYAELKKRKHEAPLPLSQNTCKIPEGFNKEYFRRRVNELKHQMLNPSNLTPDIGPDQKQDYFDRNNQSSNTDTFNNFYIQATQPPTRQEDYKLSHNNHMEILMHSLIKDEAFMDCTLSTHGKSIRAHKTVLSAMSSYLSNVLKENPCQHPIIIMPNEIAFNQLNNLIDFMYKGETTVSVEEVPSLIKAAELLQINGLAVSSGEPYMPQFITPQGTTLNKENRIRRKKKPELCPESESQDPTEEMKIKVDPFDFVNPDVLSIKEERMSMDEGSDEVSSAGPCNSDTHNSSETKSDFSLSQCSRLKNSEQTEKKDGTQNEQNTEIDPRTQNEQDTDIENKTNSLFLDLLLDKDNQPVLPQNHPVTCNNSSESEPSSTYVCPYCEETHRPTEAFQLHLKVKHPTKPSFLCGCGRAFKKQRLMAEHGRKCVLSNIN